MLVLYIACTTMKRSSASAAVSVALRWRLEAQTSPKRRLSMRQLSRGPRTAKAVKVKKRVSKCLARRRVRARARARARVRVRLR